ncbi:MAG: antitoxin [Candidatus Nanopelagicales bacterium]|nr:antitoxin [Candidatus Nanopelagicales bacterium]
MTTKLSVSLPDEDVAYLDSMAAPSRSAAVHAAIARHRRDALEFEYAEAFAEWQADSDRPAWDTHSADGLE